MRENNEKVFTLIHTRKKKGSEKGSEDDESVNS